MLISVGVTPNHIITISNEDHAQLFMNVYLDKFLTLGPGHIGACSLLLVWGSFVAQKGHKTVDG